MSSAARVKVQAKSLEKALLQAAEQLHVPKEQVVYEVVSQTSGGLFGFLGGGRRVEISAWTVKPTRARASAAKRPARVRSRAVETQVDETPLTKQETDALVEDLRSFCAEVCRRMANEDVEVTASLDEDRLVINIDHDYLASQINRNSKIAESLEHLLRKKPRHLKRELPFRIFVDVRGERSRRESELRDMAKDMSQKVHQDQKPVVLSYKSSYDRKIIHMALDKDDRVYTKSIGSGANRKLMILPAKDERADVSS